MNSRQRRKAAAEQHNALLIENQAYCEDKARDPEKYKVARTNGRNISRHRLATLMAMGMYPIETYRD